MDDRVAAKTENLDDALREAAGFLRRRAGPRVEIIDLSGKIYRENEIRRLLATMTDRRGSSDTGQPAHAPL